MEVVHYHYYNLNMIIIIITISVFKPGVFLSGASGGVYALIMAHLGTVIMNHRWVL